MQHKFDKYQVSKESKVAATSSSFELFVLRQKYLSELILDVAWLFKEPAPVNMQNIPVSFQIQRFNYILEVLIENESTAMLQRALKYMKIVMDNCLTTGIADADMRVYQRNINQVTDILGQKLPQKVDSTLFVRNLIPEENDFDQSFENDEHPLVSVSNQVRKWTLVYFNIYIEFAWTWKYWIVYKLDFSFSRMLSFCAGEVIKHHLFII